MAYVANIHLHVAFGAACFEHVAASASYGGYFIFRMNSLFHVSIAPCVNSLGFGTTNLELALMSTKKGIIDPST